MKSFFVGLVLIATALAVNAGGTRSMSSLPYVHGNAPVCPPGEKAVPYVVDGKLEWVCMPVS
ncbi:hypothetical protein [Dyella acidiphila]|uniref:Uncharacterized protein n=1 Tax=Dyella acidiphila TaxID=2775866 RepID=A0ABR9GEF7_9GAMM|nr:hypothetical protein [Dyella acidiphila]MBE1162430.1 hypothetical protein [Dyella acidiphila]